MDAPQRLVGRLLSRREPAVKPDDPIAHMIARTAGRLRPEREYRWRLRGRLVNQYVAVREGLVRESPRQVHMGSLGRAVLYASVGLAISVSAVGAASSSALPGDPLYGVKRQVEELRMEIAPPSVRPMLAAMALEERLSEVELLAATGNWGRVALAEQEVEGAVATLRGLGGSLPADEVAQLAHHAQVLTALLARAPDSARAGLQRALVASAGAANAANLDNHVDQENLQGSGAGAATNQSNANQTGKGTQAGGGGTDSSPKPTEAPTPTSSPANPKTPVPHPTPPATPQPSSDPDGNTRPH
jgi:Domain of unknown function (DUF5667)